MRHEADLSAQRWTVDERADYDFVRSVYAALYPGQHDFGMKEILAFVRAHPDVAGINRGIERNEGYLRSLKEDQKVN